MLIVLNLLMALGSIWVFMRMTPAIEVIIARNERSLQACDDMLVIMAGTVSSRDVAQRQQSFAAALEKVRLNITESHEGETVAAISKNYRQALRGNHRARKLVLAQLVQLTHINREAMVSADKQAKQYGHAGAWGVVFMAIGVFFAAMLFLRSIRKNLAEPLIQISSVVAAQLEGDTLRRCGGANVPGEIKSLYDGINELLDKNQAQVAGCQKRL